MSALRTAIYHRYKRDLAGLQELYNQVTETAIALATDGGRQEMSLTIGGQTVTYSSADLAKIEQMLATIEAVQAMIELGSTPAETRKSRYK